MQWESGEEELQSQMGLVSEIQQKEQNEEKNQKEWKEDEERPMKELKEKWLKEEMKLEQQLQKVVKRK